MSYYNINEKDWKLFRSKSVIWQRSYMEKLNNEYIDLLSTNDPPEDKFWDLEERINSDKKSVGVCMQMSRSQMHTNIIRLINEGVISPDDLEDFSSDLKEFVSFLFKEH